MIPKSILAFSLLIFLCTGCIKDTGTTGFSSPTNPEDAAIVSTQTFNEINSYTDIFFSSTGLKSALAGTICPAVSFSLSTLPFSLTLDWGDGCPGNDGIVRKGKIIISLTGIMNVAGSSASFTFDNFYSDGHKVSGNHTITYMGIDGINNWPKYQITTDARFDFGDGKFITYQANTRRWQSEGSSTTTLADDVWREEGTWGGTTASGETWTATSTSALIKSSSCNWFSQGIIQITPTGESPITIDFGDGTCDNKVTITKNGVSAVVTLR